MTFPDYDSLKMAAQCHGFRDPQPNEQEDQYRAALADYVEETGYDGKGHVIEAMEIRTGRGWDDFSENENIQLVLREMNKQAKKNT